MRTTEMVLIAPFLKTSNFYLPAYLYIYYLWSKDLVLLLLDFNESFNDVSYSVFEQGSLQEPKHVIFVDRLIIFMQRKTPYYRKYICVKSALWIMLFGLYNHLDSL